MLEKHFFHCVNTFSIFTTNMTTKGFISPSSQVHNHMNALYLPWKYWIQMNNGEGVKFFKKWNFLETAQTYYPNHLSTLRTHPTLHYPNHLHDMIPWGVRGERAFVCRKWAFGISCDPLKIQPGRRNLSPSTSLTPLLTISLKC